MEYTNLTQGSHTFRVRAEDLYGNVDPSPASYTWSVDVTPTETTLVSTPTNPSNASASFSFSSSEAGTTYECALDAGGFTSCGSTVSYGAIARDLAQLLGGSLTASLENGLITFHLELPTSGSATASRAPAGQSV